MSKRMPLWIVRVLPSWITVWLGCVLSYPILADDPKQESSQEAEVPVSQRVAELDQQISEIGQQTSIAREEWLQLKNESADLQLKLSFMEGRLTSLDNVRQKLHAEIEELLKKSVDWVSFSQQIAPIFQNHCVACHSARNPLGSYTMTHYAAIMSQGESGNTIQVGSADDSLLFQMISDGSMPKDASSLSNEQVELVRRWIDQGARLDASAHPDTPLFRLSPRQPHPTAPENYATSLPVTAIAIDPQGGQIATSGYHEVLLWTWPNRQLQRRIGNVAQRVYKLAFHPDGSKLAVASGTPGRTGELKLIELSSDDRSTDLWVSHDSVLCLAFSPNGRYLACGDTSGSVVVFDLTSENKELWQTRDHSDWICSIAWSSDSMRLVTASRDRTCKVFHGLSGQLQMTWSGHQNAVNTALFSNDGRHGVSAGQDGGLRIWRTDDGKQISELQGFDGTIVSLQLLESPNLLASTETGMLGVVDILQGKMKRDLRLSRPWTHCASVFPGHQNVAVGSQDGRVSIAKLDSSDSAEVSQVVEWLAQPGDFD